MAKTPPDQIVISNLELSCNIGITEEEQAEPQRLTVSLVLELNLTCGAMEDRIENTIDYFAVAQSVKAFAAARPRRLIETLAEEIAGHVINRFNVWRLSLELRKYILPDTEYVAVRIERPLN